MAEKSYLKNQEKRLLEGVSYLRIYAKGVLEETGIPLSQSIFALNYIAKLLEYDVWYAWNIKNEQQIHYIMSSKPDLINVLY